MREARAEWQRIQRGMATMSLTLALGDPLLVPQSPVQVQVSRIRLRHWLATKVTHTMGDGGFVTRVAMETSGD